MMLHRVVGKKTLPIGKLGHHRKFFHVDENRDTTGFGGAYNNGAVFEVSAKGLPRKEKVIYSFIGAPDGASPSAGLTAGPNGSFYGSASGWGPENYGTIFQLTLRSKPVAPGPRPFSMVSPCRRLAAFLMAGSFSIPRATSMAPPAWVETTPATPASTMAAASSSN